MSNNFRNIDDDDEQGHNEHSFSRNYFVLKPSEVGFFDLLRLLCFQDLSERKFVECSNEEQEYSPKLRDLSSRFLVFVSVLGQVILLMVKKPMASIGYVIETWLNLVQCNGGLLKLLLNLITGRVAWPDEEGATYRSMIGYLDTRLDLKPNMITKSCACTSDIVHHGHDHDDLAKKFNNIKFICIMAAKLSYENPATIQAVVEHRWEMKLIGSYKFSNDFHSNLSTKAMMLQDKDLVVVAFKGTAPFDADDWSTDVGVSWYELKGIGRIHAGFMKALGLQRIKGWPKDIDMGEDQPKFAYYTIREKLRSMLQGHGKPRFVITGHSLGGALAILFAAVLLLHEEEDLLDRLDGVYTFGQPRVGDEKFGEFMKEKLMDNNVRYFRYVYCNDMVPRLPYDGRSIWYKHFGHCFYYNSFYKGKVLMEEPNKNYFSVPWFIPMRINAAWELIRSFTLPLTKGPDFKEGWTLRFFRLIGLFIPGLSDHGPQDYDNVTRLSNEHPSP